MTPDDFDVIKGITMVLAEIGGIVAVGYGVDTLRNHFEWIRRIAP